MRLTGSVLVLSCSRLEACLEFYQSALQFVIIRQRRSAAEIEWVYLASGQCFLMLEKQAPEKNSKPDHSRLYLYTDDIAGLHHFLQARGFVPGEIRNTEYQMREFDLSDPDGHRLSIGEKT
jgi:uncharacterized glyoxalase superfamily protein PhnB